MHLSAAQLESPPPAPHGGAANDGVPAAPSRSRDGEVNPTLKPFLSRNAPGADSAGLLEGPDPATVVVMGAQRSGTTMVAGILQILGVEFGDDVADRGEDIALTRTIQRMHHGLAFWRIFSVRREFARIIRQRRETWRCYGFKSPFLAPLLWFVGDKIPHPAFILTMRNPLSAAISGERWGGAAWTRALVRATFYQYLYALFAANTKRPILLCGFEDGVRDVDRLLDELAGFLGVAVTADMRARVRTFVQPAVGYRTTRRLQGWIEKMTPERAVGWVADLTDPSRTLTVEVCLAGETIARESADRLRADVAAAGHHTTGRCGFDVSFPRPLSEAEIRGIRIYIPELNHTLRFGLDGNVRSLYLPGDGHSSS